MASQATYDLRKVALEAASRLHGGKGETYSYEVLDTADKYYNWLVKP